MTHTQEEADAELREMIHAAIMGKSFDDADTIMAAVQAHTARIREEAEKRAYLKGYNTGWNVGKRFNPKKVGYFASQLEETAKNLRFIEARLSLIQPKEKK